MSTLRERIMTALVAYDTDLLGYRSVPNLVNAIRAALAATVPDTVPDTEDPASPFDPARMYHGTCPKCGEYEHRPAHPDAANPRLADRESASDRDELAYRFAHQDETRAAAEAEIAECVEAHQPDTEQHTADVEALGDEVWNEEPNAAELDLIAAQACLDRAAAEGSA